MDIKFLAGTQSAYEGLESKVEGTFYYTTDKHNLYIGDVQLNNGDLVGSLEKLTTDAKDSIVNAVNELDKNINDLNGKIGDISSLTTEELTTLVDVINDIKSTLEELKTAEVVAVTPTPDETLQKKYNVTQGGESVGTIEIEKITIESQSGADKAKTYTLKQGERTIGTINIPKDLVVSSGEVIDNPPDHELGTYIKLVLNNEQELFINVGKLVDIYTVSEESTAIELTIENHQIKAQIKAGQVTSEMLASDVLTDFLTAEDLNTLIIDGTENGTFKVNGEAVHVYGLKSAAYKEETDFIPSTWGVYPEE